MDESLLEIGTDKVDTEVPSPAAGIVAEILVPEGEVVDVGTLIALIETDATVTVSDGDTDQIEASESAPEQAVPAAEVGLPAAAPESRR